MRVDKLPSGKWRARLQTDGRRHVATFQTKQQAQEWETVTLAQGIQGTCPSHVTVGQYAEKWFGDDDASLRRPRRTIGSCQSYERRFELWPRMIVPMG